ncbi:leucine-rich repeat protein [Tanacetum coccineum]
MYTMSDSDVAGPLPTWLQKMHIALLDLSHNKLSGPVTNLPNEGYVDSSVVYSKALCLQDNLFNESIPISLCRRTDLQYLDLSRNRLTGRVPELLRRLNLNDNHFTGELPPALGNLRELRMLDLGDNGFTGNIPEWVGENLRKLTVFRLHKNNFTGSIPQSLCSNSYLQILDVAHNILMGHIPHCLGKLNVGEIPVELISLSALMGLNLSNNNLNGGISDSIGNMKTLISLDFSGNQLTGNQLQTLTDPSIYVGNIDLCGAPLPKNCSNNENQTTMHKNNEAANHKSNKVWFYMDIMGGFAAGFWDFIGVLLFKKHWRHKLYRFSEEIMDKIYIAVVLRVHKMKRGRESV